MSGSPGSPLLRITWTDPETEASGYMVVDRLVSGIATGGIRMRAGCTEDEVAALARQMSLKAAAFRLPVGGAKGGIDYDPTAADAEGVRLRFLQAMRPLLEGTWVTAGDLGTPQELLDRLFLQAGIDSTSLHAGIVRSGEPETVRERITRAFTRHSDTPGMSELIGGFGVAEAALAGLGHTGVEPGRARAVVQGFGAMGASSARYLARAGVTIVGVADAEGLVVNTERGLDIESLFHARSPQGVVDRSTLRADDRLLPGPEWLSLDAEVLIPAAVSNVVTAANCDTVRARLVVEAANVPVTADAEARLMDRGVAVIPDFVANAGAAACAWWVIFGDVEDVAGAQHRLSAEMRPLVATIMAAWAGGAASPREAAWQQADHNHARLAAEFGGTVPAKPLFTSRPVPVP